MHSNDFSMKSKKILRFLLGDSGGGLYLLENGKFTLVGITSAGFGCGVDHQPGIYHNVQLTAKWIQNVLNRFH